MDEKTKKVFSAFLEITTATYWKIHHDCGAEFNPYECKPCGHFNFCHNVKIVSDELAGD